MKLSAEKTYNKLKTFIKFWEMCSWYKWTAELETCLALVTAVRKIAMKTKQTNLV